MTMVLPAMSGSQVSSWHALLDLHEAHPTGWTLVGGQMVHLHCAERGAAPQRPTDDVDTLLDVRAEPHVLLAVTSILHNRGFRPAGETWTGHQHRWERDGAVVDILIPRHLGERAANRRGVTGGTTIETPGAQQALDRTEARGVSVAGREGAVRRPNLLGALVAKAAANTVALDPRRGRHLSDFAVLATLLRPDDALASAGPRDRHYLDGMLAAMAEDRRPWARVDGAEEGLDRLKLALGAAPTSASTRSRASWPPPRTHGAGDRAGADVERSPD
ncbi:hypothetical protein ACWFNE_20765 [Cellulomonas sp. NPDC055163]